MAAHALTILRQLAKRMIDADRDIVAGLPRFTVAQVVENVDLGLGAPGLDPGFESVWWDRINQANQVLKQRLRTDMDFSAKRSPEYWRLFETITAAAYAHQWMSAYPAMEEVRAAMNAYMGDDEERRSLRYREFMESDTAKVEARKLIADHVPLDRTASQVW